MADNPQRIDFVKLYTTTASVMQVKIKTNGFFFTNRILMNLSNY